MSSRKSQRWKDRQKGPEEKSPAQKAAELKSTIGDIQARQHKLSSEISAKRRFVGDLTSELVSLVKEFDDNNDRLYDIDHSAVVKLPR